MTDIPIPENDQNTIQRAIKHATEWASKHQWEVGVAEMALGAAVLSWAVQNGVVEMGRDLIATQLSGINTEAAVGSGVGAGIGGTAAAFVGSVGVAAMGTAFAVPALVLIGSGAAVFGAFGYVVGDQIHGFLQPTLSDVALAGSAALIGVALLVDGARRVIKDKRVLNMVSKVSEHVIHLVPFSGKVVARSLAELKAIAASMAAVPESAADAAGTVAMSATMAAAGTAAGAAAAAASVTVLGSSSLGALALSLGLVSAPLWPVIAGGAAGATLGYGLWKAARHFMLKPQRGGSERNETE